MNLRDLQQFLDNPNDTDRIAELQRQFAAILHARKCIQQKTAACCTLSICPTWRSLLCHYLNCHCGLKCDFESCGSTRVLLEHFQSCNKPECRFCEPLRKSKRTTTTTTCSQSTFYSNSPSSSKCTSSSAYFKSTWSNSTYSAREAYFSTYSTDYVETHRSGTTITSTYLRSPYGKTERIQRELIVMFHVQRCADLDRENHIMPHNILCSVPHCSTMKRTLIHIAMCQSESCDFPECDVTRSIIQHWLRCPKDCCDICNPVLDSIPAIDGGSDYEMDDKLLALLYTSTNGLIGIAPSDLSSYEANWSVTNDGNEVFCETVISPLNGKRKLSNDELDSLETSSIGVLKRKRC
ncbi:hypothetical protein M3Y98_00427900 [Aphelenchoides besseyi]|nr:hypothetical protein M3Y98_00427900 [Aphelenchoides besseyi]